MGVCTKTYRQSADVVDTCPNDVDLVLFVDDANLSVFRTWEKLKECLTTAVGPRNAIKGVVGSGEADDPVEGSSLFQSTKLIGMGADNNGRMVAILAEIIISNYGNNASFTLDNNTGLIDISPNTFQAGDSWFIDLNQ